MPAILEKKQAEDFISMKNNIIITVLLSVIALVSSCEEDSNSNSTDFFPEVQVNTNVNLLLPQYNSLSLLQGYVYLPEGYRGIILYRTAGDEFVAFDRTCPYNTTTPCSYVIADSSNFTFKCGQYNGSTYEPCCDSRFDASTGIRLSGPAQRSLKQYYTRRTENIIYISSFPF